MTGPWGPDLNVFLLSGKWSFKTGLLKFSCACKSPEGWPSDSVGSGPKNLHLQQAPSCCCPTAQGHSLRKHFAIKPRSFCIILVTRQLLLLTSFLFVSYPQRFCELLRGQAPCFLLLGTCRVPNTVALSFYWVTEWNEWMRETNPAANLQVSFLILFNSILFFPFWILTYGNQKRKRVQAD